ncbi:DsbC family protein, partial [Francisella tularensis subsp. holarctica]|nr:DsbC family protein [Francisella tularensis subsp. holarctica]
MKKKSFSILVLFVVILLVVLYIFSTNNLNKISPDNKQGLYLV